MFKKLLIALVILGGFLMSASSANALWGRRAYYGAYYRPYYYGTYYRPYYYGAYYRPYYYGAYYRPYAGYYPGYYGFGVGVY